jgi:hypothetical protein
MHQSVNPQDKSRNKVKEKVLNRLGRPSDLFKIDAYNVYDNKWRINVWCDRKPKEDSNCTVESKELRHSYFCVMTEGGTLRCKPKISKLYRRGDKEQ